MGSPGEPAPLTPALWEAEAPWLQIGPKKRWGWLSAEALGSIPRTPKRKANPLRPQEGGRVSGPCPTLTRSSSLALGTGEPRPEAKEAGLSPRSRRAGTQTGAFPQGVLAGLGGSEGWSWARAGRVQG